jgi:hypothetical protein
MEEIWKGTEYIGELCIMSVITERMDEFYLLWINEQVRKKERKTRRKKDE